MHLRAFLSRISSRADCSSRLGLTVTPSISSVMWENSAFLRFFSFLFFCHVTAYKRSSDCYMLVGHARTYTGLHT